MLRLGSGVWQSKVGRVPLGVRRRVVTGVTALLTLAALVSGIHILTMPAGASEIDAPASATELTGSSLQTILLAQMSETSVPFRYVKGLSVQGSWLCYGFADGTYHCTLHWHRDAAGHPVSDRPDFVPTGSSSSSGGSGSTVSGGIASSGQPCREAVRWPATIRQWTVPLGCYANVYKPNPANYPSRPSYGFCNWWPEVLHPQLQGRAALALPSHSTPRVGATIRFAPFVQGASADGHYGYVVAIAPGGQWVLSSEMNFYWRGGGFARVIYRFVHVGAGVSFLY